MFSFIFLKYYIILHILFAIFFSKIIIPFWKSNLKLKIWLYPRLAGIYYLYIIMQWIKIQSKVSNWISTMTIWAPFCIKYAAYIICGRKVIQELGRDVFAIQENCSEEWLSLDLILFIITKIIDVAMAISHVFFVTTC